MNRPDAIPLRTQQDVISARQLVRVLLQEKKFSLIDQTKFVTAASELARNTLVHGGGGEMLINVDESDGRTCVRLTFQDEGPGIPDLNLALKDGWTSGGGLGMGLPGTRRLVNEFDIQSEVGKGTRVVIARWR